MPTTLLTRPRLWWLLAGSAIAVTSILLLPFGSSIEAQEAAEDPRVIDPADPCSVPSPPVPFTDRDQIAEVHLATVDCAFAQNITHGSRDGTTYTPRAAVRRDQMASFIIRTLQAAGGVDIPSPSNQGFTDISGNTHEDAINQLAALGITQGRTATSYAPAESVRRDQMASFILRAANTVYGTTFEAVETGYFSDVAATNVHRQNIDAAFEFFGLTAGQTATTYAPDQSVRRDQMASFLVRLLDVTELTDDSSATTNLLPGANGLLEGVGQQVLPGDNGLLDGVGDLLDDVTGLLDGGDNGLLDSDNGLLEGASSSGDNPQPDDQQPDDQQPDDQQPDDGGLIGRIIP